VGKNPVVIFPIKKIINTDPYIDRTAALHTRETRIRELAFSDWRKAYGVGMKDQGTTCLEMSSSGM